MEFQTLSMQLLFGPGMGRYIFSKGNIIGGLIRKKDPLCPRVTRGTNPIHDVIKAIEMSPTLRPISNWEGIPDYVDDGKAPNCVTNG